MACDVPHLCQFIPIQAEVNFNTVFSSNYCPVSAFMKKRQPYPTIKWDKVFKNRPSKICGRQPLKVLLGPFLKILSQIIVIFHSAMCFTLPWYLTMMSTRHDFLLCPCSCPCIFLFLTLFNTKRSETVRIIIFKPI